MKANLNYFQESSICNKELIIRVLVTVGKDLSFLNGMIQAYTGNSQGMCYKYRLVFHFFEGTFSFFHSIPFVVPGEVTVLGLICMSDIN